MEFPTETPPLVPQQQLTRSDSATSATAEKEGATRTTRTAATRVLSGPRPPPLGLQPPKGRPECPLQRPAPCPLAPPGPALGGPPSGAGRAPLGPGRWAPMAAQGGPCLPVVKSAAQNSGHLGHRPRGAPCSGLHLPLLHLLPPALSHGAGPRPKHLGEAGGRARTPTHLGAGHLPAAAELQALGAQRGPPE